MPFKSEKQRRYMFSQHPEIAKAWAHGEHSKAGKKGHKMPKKKHSMPKADKHGFY
jgi:hypothetical protein